MKKLSFTGIFLVLMLAACGQQPWQRGDVLIENLLTTRSATVEAYIDGVKQKTLALEPNGHDTIGFGPQIGQSVCINMEADNTRTAYKFTVQKTYPYAYTNQVIEREGKVELIADPSATVVSKCP
ncbi:hypothetical protein [Deinococcus sp. S9]|uniref:hypothetical protein n=1 Tax=Deinococcus sp. S9 TaxID=2545754 RepID=UPI001054B07C|nr:hypothetical protein [Deinococcus sp. S9]TDE84583.1 hypothetical protein E0686_16480 [Deinococcus sp. S9]